MVQKMTSFSVCTDDLMYDLFYAKEMLIHLEKTDANEQNAKTNKPNCTEQKHTS